MSNPTRGATAVGWAATAAELLIVVWAVPVVILLVGAPIALSIAFVLFIAQKLTGI